MKVVGCLLSAIGLIVASGCSSSDPPIPQDEARQAGKQVSDFPTATYDYFRDMDMTADGGTLRPLALDADEIKGRNTWILWCGGNEAFWDWLANHSYGFMDLLKLVASPDADAARLKRRKRFDDTGLINEPGFQPAAEPEFGLFLEVPADPATPQPRESVYGKGSGVVGLRLFKNPKFDKAAQRRWDAKRYFNDPDYFGDPELVRPYRVGMSCGFCHVGPHPLSPPAQPHEPQWKNLSSTIGSQYFRTRAVFGGLLKPDNFIYHVLDSQPPGTIDTSLVASDNINNPNTMNAIFGVSARLDRAGIQLHHQLLDRGKKAADQKKGGGKVEGNEGRAEASPPSFNFPERLTEEQIAALPSLLRGDEDSRKNPRPVPRILLDGADSVGAWGALARVYLNIGTYHERWIQLHNPLLGFAPQKPFEIEACEANSLYWAVNRERVEYLAKFFLKSTDPMRLKDAPGGAAFLKKDAKEEVVGEPWHADLEAGRKVFARRCIICHSSKQPQQIWEKHRDAIDKGDLLTIMELPEYQAWAQKEVHGQQFWTDNLLSTDHRVPVTLLRTNAGRALATNGIGGEMWEDFSSETYKSLPAVGKIRYFDPYKKDYDNFDAPGGGRGYYRPASLISVWATAPYLHNNSCGKFNNDPSVKGRMEAFDDGIRKLLVVVNEEQRAGKSRDEIFELAARQRWRMGSDLNGASRERLEADHGLIWRTPEDCYVRIPAKHLPGLLRNLTGFGDNFLTDHPWVLPAAGLAVALFFLLLSTRAARGWRVLGYLFILASVAAAFVSYFAAGRLGDLEVGPIPRGTAVNLLANLDPKEQDKTLSALRDTVRVMRKGRVLKMDSETLRGLLEKEVAPRLLAASKCPDLVMDRGHYFAAELTEADLKSLIELLKTF